jgi:phosphohistidine phosphatase
MLLYIVRHAWAYEHGDPRWPDDSQRPLEKEGAERMAKVAKQLVERGFAPARIATSPYLRCRQTADILAEHAPGGPSIEDLDALRPGSDLAALIAWSRDAAVGGDVCWVGHMPDVAFLAAALVSEGDASLRFAKGATAAIRFDDKLAPGAGELQWLATAKVLGV